MRLYPAIDIKDGQCVRLKKGLFNEVTVYSDTPYKITEGVGIIYIIGKPVSCQHP